MIQYLVVGLIVLFAALSAAARYLPKSWRERLVYLLSRGSGKGRLVRWLGTDASCVSGCDTCGSCAPAPLAGQDPQGRKVIEVHLKR